MQNKESVSIFTLSAGQWCIDVTSGKKCMFVPVVGVKSRLWCLVTIDAILFYGDTDRQVILIDAPVFAKQVPAIDHDLRRQYDAALLMDVIPFNLIHLIKHRHELAQQGGYAAIELIQADNLNIRILLGL